MANPQITLEGNLTRDVELRYTPNGVAVGKFGIAVEHYRGRDNDKEVSFFNVTTFKELAEHCADSLGKGTRVVVVGEPKIRQWEKDGEKHSAFELVADSVALSIRFVTAKVDAKRSDGGERRPPTTEAPVAYDDDEEPF